MDTGLDYAFPDDIEDRHYVRERQKMQLLEKMQQDEISRLDEVRGGTRRAPNYRNQDPEHPATRDENNNNNNRPARELTCTCVNNPFQDPRQRTAESDTILLADGRTVRLGSRGETIDLQGISTSSGSDLATTDLSDMLVAEKTSVYSNLNKILVNSESLYNKQRQVRVTHHVRELQYHTQQLINSTSRPDLLRELIQIDKASKCPIHSGGSPVSPL